jgi:hypothetical protein
MGKKDLKVILLAKQRPLFPPRAAKSGNIKAADNTLSGSATAS